MLFQLVLTKFSKSELFSCLPKVNHVIKSCKEPIAFFLFNRPKAALGFSFAKHPFLLRAQSFYARLRRLTCKQTPIWQHRNSALFVRVLVILITFQIIEELFHRGIELKTSKIEFTDRRHQNKQGFEGKKLSGKEFVAFEEYSMCGRHCRLGELHAKILTVFLPRFSRLFCLLSSRILQHNLLDLYLLVELVRRYKLLLFATISLPHRNRCVKLITDRGLELAQSRPACGHCDMQICHSDVDTFRKSVGSTRQRPISKRQLSLIVPVPRCAEFVHFTGVTGPFVLFCPFFFRRTYFHSLTELK